MQIHVTLPSRMKMEYSVTMEVKKSITLEDLFHQIFEHAKHTVMHTNLIELNKSNIKLFDENNMEIRNDTELQAKMHDLARFAVIIKNDH